MAPDTILIIGSKKGKEPLWPLPAKPDICSCPKNSADSQKYESHDAMSQLNFKKVFKNNCQTHVGLSKISRQNLDQEE